MFRPEILKQEIKVFFVKYNDPIYVKLEKLDIMIRLASQANIAQVYFIYKKSLLYRFTLCVCFLLKHTDNVCVIKWRKIYSILQGPVKPVFSFSIYLF